jgi:hypothetical protein
MKPKSINIAIVTFDLKGANKADYGWVNKRFMGIRLMKRIPVPYKKDFPVLPANTYVGKIPALKGQGRRI